MDRYNHFSEKRLQEIERKIAILERVNRRKITDPEFIFLDNAELKQLLCISDSAAARWRLQGKLRFSVVGRKIYYRLSDISKMIREHQIIRKYHNEQQDQPQEDTDRE